MEQNIYLLMMLGIIFIGEKMKRLLIYLKSADINRVINVHDSYLEKIIRNNTKKYYMAISKGSGYFYMTKFNPDAETFEQYITNPETITITINNKKKGNLQHVILLASGLNLKNGRDYLRIENEQNELVGISFFPIKEQIINSLVRALDDETGMGR